VDGTLISQVDTTDKTVKENVPIAFQILVQSTGRCHVFQPIHQNVRKSQSPQQRSEFHDRDEATEVLDLVFRVGSVELDKTILLPGTLL
jgi:hypothetical protein